MKTVLVSELQWNVLSTVIGNYFKLKVSFWRILNLKFKLNDHKSIEDEKNYNRNKQNKD